MNTVDELYRGFVTPPADCRPFVRWWWSGNAVTEEGIRRELDCMQSAGIGGVEINPNGTSPDPESAPPKRWLSDEFCRMVAFASGECARRGMVADMIGGAGWPFGCPELTEDQGCQGIKLAKINADGPQTLAINPQELKERTIWTSSPDRSTTPYAKAWESYVDEATPHRAWVVPQDASVADMGPGIPLQADDQGHVQVELPQGSHTVYLTVTKKRWRDILCWNIQGENAWRLNHFDENAVRIYLRRITDALSPHLGGTLGNSLRSVFCDSYELGEEYWTDDFLNSFEQQRGYDLIPYLPAMLERHSWKLDHPEADTIRRVTSDVLETLQELMNERFAKTFADWCHDEGVDCRIQAYGRPWTDLRGKMLADIPEGECWLWRDAPVPTTLRHFSPSTNRQVATAANLAGRQVVSCESFTNTETPFSASLSHFKTGTDLLIATGINNIILHGWGYTPPETDFPGWFRMGSFISPYNSWWPYFKNWTEYTARLQWVFRQGRSCARVALLGPEIDPTWKYLDDSYWQCP